jgi:ATP-dependent Clp protease protease subunit
MIPDDLDRADWLRGRLLRDRLVLLGGEIDDERATMVATELMALDAAGDDPVTLHVDAHGGTLAAGLMIIDVIDLLGVPVHARCTGRADGPALGIVAVAHRRSATPHARFRFGVPETSIFGRVDDLELRAREHAAQVDVYVRRLAEATGRPLERVEADVERREWLDADAARDAGIIDEIERPRPRMARSS